MCQVKFRFMGFGRDALGELICFLYHPPRCGYAIAWPDTCRASRHNRRRTGAAGQRSV